VGHQGPSPLRITTRRRGEARLLTVEGVLDLSTYRILRDSIVKAGLDETSAVIVDFTGLQVPSPATLAVFTSAAWQLSRWPDVPLALVCRDAAARETLVRNGVARYVAVYPDVAAAADAIDSAGVHGVRRRAREELPRDQCAVERARGLIIDCLLKWSHQELIAAATVVAQELVGNVLAHTDSAPEIRIEIRGSAVTVAVTDASTRPASLPESTFDGPRSGLELVAEVSRASWGSVPSLSGKTVWATVTDYGR
jgi:hypothetical protein